MSWLIISLGPVVEAGIFNYQLTYDKAGNLQQGFDQYFEYNNYNQLARVRQNNANGTIIEEYSYDDQGERIKKVEPQINQTTYYISDNFIQVVNSTGAYNTTYYFDGNTLIGRKDPDGKKFFYHPDHLGSTDLVTNETGGVAEETTYKPYGEIQSGGDSRFLYTGKELDDNTGLYYYGARYYDPLFHHFTQPDQNIPNIYNPQDLNRYAYVRNNPYKYVDPSGENPVVAIAISVGLNAFAGAALEFIEQSFDTKEGYQKGAIFKAAGVGAVGGLVGGFASVGIKSAISLTRLANLIKASKAARVGVNVGLTGVDVLASAQTQKIITGEYPSPTEISIGATLSYGQQTVLGQDISPQNQVEEKTTTANLFEILRQTNRLQREGISAISIGRGSYGNSEEERHAIMVAQGRDCGERCAKEALARQGRRCGVQCAKEKLAEQGRL